MSAKVDPEQNETRALFGIADIQGNEILEVGCGDGRLTWRYAGKAARVLAIEPYGESVLQARRAVPEELAGRVEFRHASFEEFAADHARAAFDLVILSWSLCWMDWEGMVHALEDAQRLLKPAGALVDIHPTPEAPSFRVYRDGEVIFSEPYPSRSAESYRLADRAVELSMQRRLFVMERREVFSFATYAPTIADLQAYFEVANAFDDVQPDPEILAQRADLFTRVDEVLRSAGEGAEVALVENGQIARLRPAYDSDELPAAIR